MCLSETFGYMKFLFLALVNNSVCVYQKHLGTELLTRAKKGNFMYVNGVNIYFFNLAIFCCGLQELEKGVAINR